MTDAVTALRHEFPALGLTLAFVPKKQRGGIADVMLLWLEVMRASTASESLIAAARIAWWRDAIADNKPQGVPLAERLISQDAIPNAALTAMLEKIISITIDGGDNGAIMHAFAPPMTTAFGGSAQELAHILLGFNMAMSGEGVDLPKPTSTLPLPFLMMAWLAKAPERLAYPREKPLLAVSMIMALLRGAV